MTLGVGWGRFFPLFCIGLAALGQALGVELATETRLVYAVLDGEPAAEVAVRLRERGLAKREIAKATRARIAEIAEQQDRLMARLGQVDGLVEARFSRLANAVKVRLPLGQLERLRRLDDVADVQPVAQFHRLTSSSSLVSDQENSFKISKFPSFMTAQVSEKGYKITTQSG